MIGKLCARNESTGVVRLQIRLQTLFTSPFPPAKCHKLT